jgi:hypothetical protein
MVKKDNVNHNKLLLKFLLDITILNNKFDPSNRIFQLEYDITTVLAV